MSGLIKILAMAAMVIDHVGMLFFPEIWVMRAIGRISMPVFAYCIAQGYKYTSSLRRYVRRVIIFALVAQIPYFFVFSLKLNILFCFALSLLILYVKDSISRWCYLLLIPLYAVNMEYGIYSIIAVLIFNELEEKEIACLAAFSAVTVLYAVLNCSPLQIFSIASLPLIFTFRHIRVPFGRRIFYWFYPLQWGILVAIRTLT